jgi:large subunit ribosomal protein L10
LRREGFFVFESLLCRLHPERSRVCINGEPTGHCAGGDRNPKGATVNRAEKEQAVELIRSDLAQAKSVILASHVGIDVNTVNELRSKFRASGVEYHIVKNTLAKIAIKGTDMEVMTEMFKGPTAIAYSFEDAISPAKTIKDFAKTNPKFEVRGGYLDGQVISVDEVNRLAEMPTKDELRSMVLSVFKAVPTKFVRTLNAAPISFMNVLTARKQELEKAS